MDLSFLQEIQELEEKELEAKIKAEKRAEQEMAVKNAGKKDLINRANSVSNTERKK